MSGEPKKIREYVRERWRTTEPGLRWAYIFSIIAAILFVPYSPGPYLFVELLLIPVTIGAFVQGGLRLRLLWLGFLLFDIQQIFNLGLYYNYRYGVRLNDYIAFPMIIVVLLRGFSLLDIKKTEEILYKMAPRKSLVAMFLITVIAFGIDLSFPLYGYDGYYTHYDFTRYTTTITGITQNIPLIIYISIYLFAIILVLRRQYLGAVISILILIAGTLNWIAFRLLITDYNLFYLLDRIMVFISWPKYLYLFRFIYALLLPVMAIATIIYFLARIPDKFFQQEEAFRRRK